MMMKRTMLKLDLCPLMMVDLHPIPQRRRGAN
jgi:hypothetical protein